ncbi:carbon-nitrogen hydrolase [Aspergillus taichungensis]|uniref:Carbon-nitrogen hydrolase n=1 Tax=Aspergillus taichungensis TaxID=482145 RepID=A0A2J5HIB3_9EURO|nr:carbon-nitrogen hydrolase [Aspergillus taichungensis]
MKIATLQFAPQLGDVERNIRRADELLDGLEKKRVDLLVLPEMALTGYNFPSADAIRPYVEHVGQGPSADWARKTAKKHGCKVCVGYPEVEKTIGSSESTTPTETYYNSLVVVDPHGSVLVNYRKTFLYMADEPWAAEGDAGRSFHRLQFGDEGEKEERRIATSFGICMDINPYKFEAPFTAFEFARRVLDSQSQLVVLSMAWTTMLAGEELRALGASPDLDTLNYWIQRFMPLIRERMAHGADVDGNGAEGGEKRVVLVFANRCGEDPAAVEGGEPVRYAGGSTIIAVSQRRRRGAALVGGDDGSDLDVKILCWGMMGAATEGICFADTEADPEMVFALVKPGGGS